MYAPHRIPLVTCRGMTMVNIEQVPNKNGNGHKYRVTGDERINPEHLLPTCSGISQYSDTRGGDGLLYWAVNLYIDSGNRAEFVEEQERSKSIGTALHKEIEEYIYTEQPPDNASDLFGAWYSSLNEAGVTFYTAEKPVYHPYLLYGGTLDAIGYVDGVPTLFDWKTTDEYRLDRDKQGHVTLVNGEPKRKRKSPSEFRNVPYAVQLGGYMSALKQMAEREDLVIPQQAYIIYIFKDTNNVRWEKVDLSAAERVFASCANLGESIAHKGGMYANT